MAYAASRSRNRRIPLELLKSKVVLCRACGRKRSLGASNDRFLEESQSAGARLASMPRHLERHLGYCQPIKDYLL